MVKTATNQNDDTATGSKQVNGPKSAMSPKHGKFQRSLLRCGIDLELDSLTIGHHMIQFLANRTNGRSYATMLRLSSSSSVCDVVYCG